ncbi:hypothetical protein PIB30_030276 [Stylosanthes scabra]|uniref:Uncharacterized protein n=1 Tax=Stylosanthes scabra TaxID=79078 RepID=A0ABU6ZBP2_9FABA|nr:hypothetical protein [Stylosanthes scabra]
MESDGGSSTSRQSAGGGGGGQRSSSTQGFFTAKVGNERDRATLKYHCGVYAVLYLSKTSRNPDRLFFETNNRVIDRVDSVAALQHASKFQRNVNVEDVKEEEDDVEEHFGRLKIENRVAELEERVSSIEKKSVMKMWLGCVCVIVVFMAVCVSCLQ